MTSRTASAGIDTVRPLRLVLGVDAAACLASGALLTVASPWLTDLLGLPLALSVTAGILLLVFGAWLASMAGGRGPTRPGVRTVIAVNAVWVVASLALAAGLLIDPTGLGVAFLVAQAVAVAVLTVLEAVALRRADLS
ncbi:hypothetical protein [Nocardiopsis lambiniae]|uniref:Integral membrane protein n=1 Tax=Nocardiopsis lambiniae TaxID=3075539 RepID=A0ABU2M705_9ACTN|nr:hypothetical protein [Nocardiopsis sp. DSM 44743]MDT0328432.1 hypothetical protein [Nocardiopsis sp. DSM 44743]